MIHRCNHHSNALPREIRRQQQQQQVRDLERLWALISSDYKITRGSVNLETVQVGAVGVAQDSRSSSLSRHPALKGRQSAAANGCWEPADPLRGPGMGVDHRGGNSAQVCGPSARAARNGMLNLDTGFFREIQCERVCRLLGRFLLLALSPSLFLLNQWGNSCEFASSFRRGSVSERL